MKILIAIDSFKGSLSSMGAANAAEIGIRRVFKNADIIKIPIADGGEGTVDAIASQSGAKIISEKTFDPLSRNISANFAILSDGRAVIEAAAAAGITLLAGEELNPLKTSTFGMGLQIKKAIELGARKFTIGLGGSATNDGGTGMLSALGFEFLDNDGNKIECCGGTLKNISKINSSKKIDGLDACEFDVLCDVDNPLCGERGASYIYGPQKGASPDDVKFLDSSMRSYADVAEKFSNKKSSKLAGAGAAGGLGFAFMNFLNSKIKKGIDGILDATNFDEKLSGANFVITGEGRLDAQSAMGKAPCGVAIRAKNAGVRVIAIGGAITKDSKDLYNCGVTALWSICPSPMSLEDAMKENNASENISNICENIFRLIK